MTLHELQPDGSCSCGWTTPAAAKQRLHTIRVEEIPNGPDTDYLPICSCGWEGLQTSDQFAAATERCAVLTAQLEGDLRRARRQHVA